MAVRRANDSDRDVWKFTEDAYADGLAFAARSLAFTRGRREQVNDEWPVLERIGLRH